MARECGGLRKPANALGMALSHPLIAQALLSDGAFPFKSGRGVLKKPLLIFKAGLRLKQGNRLLLGTRKPAPEPPEAGAPIT